MNRNELDPEVLVCIGRIEQAVETLIFDYHFGKTLKTKDYALTYRIELDCKGEGKTPRIRLRAGSKKDRQTFYIGNAEPALKALVFLRNNLCDRALQDLQKILESEKLHLYSNENAPNKSKVYPYTPEEVMGMIFEICNHIDPKIEPIPTDIDDLSGLFIEKSDNPHITYRRLESTVDILESDAALHENICKAIQEVTPNSVICSFSKMKVVEKYWIGKFEENSKILYFDIGWIDSKYVLRIVNLAGFPRINTRPRKMEMGSLPYIIWPPKNGLIFSTFREHKNEMRNSPFS